MTANRLYSNINIFGVNLYNEITKTRWLQKRGRIFFNSFYLTPFLHFHEYPTPLNLKENFLNIILTLIEWDISYNFKIKEQIKENR